MEIKRILVVDNNPIIVEMVAGHLAEMGYEVHKAYNGIETLDLLEQASDLPDVIILDLVMPKIDGHRLTQFLKQDERYRDIPIIILTGIAAEEDGKLLVTGADAYIAKGKIEETYANIRETLEWLKERKEPGRTRSEVLGVDKVFPREMTKELLIIKQHFDTMFQLMQEGVVEIDENHRILFANPAAERLLGRDGHRLFGERLPDLFKHNKGLRDYLDRIADSSRQGGESIQLTLGEQVARGMATPFFSDGEYVGAIFMFQDITRQVSREKSLEDLMSAVVRNAPVGLCLLDVSGRVLVTNSALAKILHQPPDWDPLGLDLAAFLSETSPPLADVIRRGMGREAAGKVAREAEYIPPGESRRQVLNVTTVTLDSLGKERVLLLLEDITEKTLLEENLLRLNEELERASSAKSTFLSMVSHELRTPLSVVRGYISLILEGKIGPGEEEVEQALLVADKRARHLQHLIEELLDLSRIESGQLSIRRENLDARKHIRETLDMFRDDTEQKNLEIEIDIPDDLPLISADHDKIHQIFTNLISNAVKFSNPGGRVNVSACRLERDVEFQVKDSGIGIPADRIDRIFEKFYQVDSSDTRKHTGTGLGLSIVKMILDTLGGSIHVKSEIGEGTTFTFTLPIGTEEISKPALPSTVCEPDSASAEGSARQRILVVEDDADTLELIRLFLSGGQYDVVVVTDAFEGLKELFRQVPDLVIADALMPLMSGLDLCHIIRNRPETALLPVIILSAAAQEDEIRRGYEVGADEYLVKPFTSQDLTDAIRKHTA